MPGYGTVGRYGVGGYRGDLQLVSVVPATMALQPLALQPLSGVTIEFSPATLSFSSQSYAPKAGAAVDFTSAELLLSTVYYLPSQGSKIDYEPPVVALTLAAVIFDTRAGVSVDLALVRAQDVLLSTVGAWGVGVGPHSYFERPLQASAPVYAPSAGARTDVVPAELSLISIAYEVGARRKPVRGQFIFYN